MCARVIGRNMNKGPPKGPLSIHRQCVGGRAGLLPDETGGNTPERLRLHGVQIPVVHHGMCRGDDPLDVEIIPSGRSSGFDLADNESGSRFSGIGLLRLTSVGKPESAEVDWLIHSNAPDARPTANRGRRIAGDSPLGSLVVPLLVPCTDESMTVHCADASTSATSNSQRQSEFRDAISLRNDGWRKVGTRDQRTYRVIPNETSGRAALW